MKKYSIIATLFIMIGSFLTIAPFTSISGFLQNQYTVLIGLACIIMSFVYVVKAFSHKEKGMLKLVPFIFFLPILYFVLNFRTIMGGV